MTRRKHLAPLVLLGAALLVGCAAPVAPPLYAWENYPNNLYQHLKASDAQVQERVAAMEKDLEKIRSRAGVPPPGFFAHLGLLYFVAGDDAKALAAFSSEESLFPEFTPYKTLLLAQYRKAK